jgi:hypothetical protein
MSRHLVLSDLAGSTIAKLCIAIGEEAAGNADLRDGLTETAFAFAIDIDPDDISFLGAEAVRNIARDPLTYALCHNTAAKLFVTLRTDVDYQTYSFRPSGTGANQQKDLHVARSHLASIVGNAARAGERMVFAVKYANHSFVVATRNRQAEILQSAMTHYTLGSSMLNNMPYVPEEIEECLIGVIGDDESAGLAQETHFLFRLANDLPTVDFEYKLARLADDDEIRRRFAERIEKSLRFYRSVIEKERSLDA